MKKVVVLGYGYVGKAAVDMVRNHYETLVVNPSVPQVPEGVQYIGDPTAEATRAYANTADMAIIAVPTPSREDGGCDTSIVESLLEWLDVPVILIKSTVEPGTTERLVAKYGKRIVMSPEYIGEGKYYVTPRMDFQKDMIKTPFLIVGGEEESRRLVLDMLVPILGPEKTYFQCESREAEIIKYMENTYFATKITFAQEMYEICRALGVDWYKVWQGWSLDPRVDVMHTAVFPDARGFSGKCLPKDTNGLVKAALGAGYRPDFLIEMIRSNGRFRPEEPMRINPDAV